jgi:hypothetical protein
MHVTVSGEGPEIGVGRVQSGIRRRQHVMEQRESRNSLAPLRNIYMGQGTALAGGTVEHSLIEEGAIIRNSCNSLCLDRGAGKIEDDKVPRRSSPKHARHLYYTTAFALVCHPHQ